MAESLRKQRWGFESLSKSQISEIKMKLKTVSIIALIGMIALVQFAKQHHLPIHPVMILMCGIGVGALLRFAWLED